MTDRTDLKKVLHAFHSQANRLMRARFDSFNSDLSRFLDFVDGTPLIHAYIENCISNHLPTGFDADSEVDEVNKSYGMIFTHFGNNAEEETAETYLVLRSMVAKNISGRDTFFFGYGGSTKYQDKVKDFLDRIVYSLINNIEDHLSQLGLEMGIDERASHVTNISNSPNTQVNTAFDKSNISATQNNVAQMSELEALLTALIDSAKPLSGDDRELVEDSAQALKEELASGAPRKRIVTPVLAALKGISGSIQFVAAVTQIAAFFAPLL